MLKFIGGNVFGGSRHTAMNCPSWSGATAINTAAETKPQRYTYFRGKRLGVDDIEATTDIIGESMPNDSIESNID